MTRLGRDARRSVPDLLARRGVRLTGPRRAVLDVVATHDGPLSVAEIHGRVLGRRINLVSVYRTLHLLVELGVLRVADVTRGGQRFELAEQFTGHHHHLICRECGRIEDLRGCLLEGDALAALRRTARRTRGFRITEHDLRLFGLCAGCGAR